MNILPKFSVAKYLVFFNNAFRYSYSYLSTLLDILTVNRNSIKKHHISHSILGLNIKKKRKLIEKTDDILFKNVKIYLCKGN